MKGTVISIDVSGQETRREIVGEPTLEVLKEAIGGGHTKAVPYFFTFPVDGSMVKCMAFCDENGKNNGLPYNRFATAHWQKSLQRQGRSLQNAHGELTDFLCGKVAIVYGDNEFMGAL
jgi:hypothetical protein